MLSKALLSESNLPRLASLWPGSCPFEEEALCLRDVGGASLVLVEAEGAIGRA